MANEQVPTPPFAPRSRHMLWRRPPHPPPSPLQAIKSGAALRGIPQLAQFVHNNGGPRLPPPPALSQFMVGTLVFVSGLPAPTTTHTYQMALRQKRPAC